MLIKTIWVNNQDHQKEISRESVIDISTSTEDVYSVKWRGKGTKQHDRSWRLITTYLHHSRI